MKLSETDIKKYLPLQTQGTAAKFEGFEIRALYKYFPKYIGQTLVDSLMEVTPDDALFAKVTPAWVVLTFLESVPFLDVVLTSTGFGVVRNTTIAPASTERVNALATACQVAANDYMDTLLAWLEQNAANYATWNKSCLNEGSLIPNVSVFDQFIDINVSRSKFIDLKRRINQVELIRIKNVLSSPFYAELLTGSDAVVKPLVQRALTFYAMAQLEIESNPDAKVNALMINADKSLAEAKTYLKNHLTDYPTYAANGYEAPYDNATDGVDSGFFIAGGTA